MQDVSLMRLQELAPRQCAIVRGIDGPDEDLQRLMSMGVCAGRIVEIIQRGDPLILQVYGTRIGLSARLALRILVEPCVSEPLAASSMNQHPVRENR